MTASAPASSPLRFATAADFHAWYQRQEGRYEWVDGLAVAMAGPSPRHCGIEANLVTDLNIVLRGRGRECSALPAGQMISVRDGRGYRHADTTIVCGERQFDRQGALINPTVLIEVLSRSTEGDDRSDKWDEYRRIPSLRDYLLVGQRHMRVDHFQRQGDLWLSLPSYTEIGQMITLTDGVSLPIGAIYEGVWSLPGDEP